VSNKSNRKVITYHFLLTVDEGAEVKIKDDFGVKSAMGDVTEV
jgi:hypothetical protein